MEDNEILELYRRRDEAAIRETERKYGPLCRSVARHILGGAEDAEECVNDVLHQAWNAIPPQSPERLGAWLGKVTWNLALNIWKRDRAQKRDCGMTRLLSELDECVPAPAAVERELEDKELSAAIDGWLRTLPREDRTLFLRRYWYGVELPGAGGGAGRVPQPAGAEDVPPAAELEKRIRNGGLYSMNERKAEKLYHGVTNVGDDLIQEAGVAQLPKRKKTAAWRWGIIAACLCGTLLLTVGAAAIRQLTVQVVKGNRIGYQIYGEAAQFSLDDFSPELIAACEGNPDPRRDVVQPRFATKEETWDFVGRGVPCVWADGGDEKSAKSEDYKYRVALWQDGETKGLDGVEVEYYLEPVPGMDAIVHMMIFAETIELPEGWDGMIGGMLKNQGQAERLENYTMANGSVAEVIMLREDDGCTDWYGIFMYKGILYQVDMSNWMNYWPEAELVSQLHGVLDSFQ